MIVELQKRLSERVHENFNIFCYVAYEREHQFDINAHNVTRPHKSSHTKCIVTNVWRQITQTYHELARFEFQDYWDNFLLILNK